MNRRWTHVPWGLSRAVLAGVASYILAQIIAAYALSWYPMMRGWDTVRSNSWLDNAVSAQFFYVFITESLTLLVLWAFVRKFKHGVRKALGIARWPQWKDVLYGTAGIVVYIALYGIVLAVVNAVRPVDMNQQQDVGFQQAHSAFALFLTFVSLVVLPPLVEEITFRGLLYSGFRKRFRPIVAGLCTSILFAAPHLLTGQGDGLLWIAAIDTFSLSLVLCFLRERTGALYSGMVVHAIKNCIAFVSLFVLTTS